MAEHLFRKMLADAGLSEIQVDSAGVSPAAWLSTPFEMKWALEQEGVEKIVHSPRGLTQDRMTSADIILVMEEGHKAAVLARFPELKNKVFLLKEYAGIPGDDKEISDPFGQSKDVYRRTLSEIKEALVKVLDRLKNR